MAQQLSRERVEEIIKNAPQGSDPVRIVEKLIDRGYQIEGLNDAPVQQQNPSLLQRAEDIGSTVTNALGGRNVAETFGAEIAKMGASDEERALIQQPGVKETAGSALALGSIFAPVGRIAQGVVRGARALGIGGKSAQIAGNVTAGGTVGAMADTGLSMAEGGNPTLGLGAILGAGIPAAAPIAKALSKQAGKFAGQGVAEIQGALTGTSAETIEQAFNAARTGGDDLAQYTAALRGQTTPEALVNNVRESITSINTQRQQLFRSTLEELGDITVNTEPASTGFVQQLADAGITISNDGVLDFSKSKLKLVPSAQTKIQTAWQELSSLPPQTTLAEIDTTRQAIKALSLSGDDPSANLANKLLDDAVRDLRSVGEQVDGYGTMLDNYAETSEFLDELERGLSTGDRSTIDQAYRRMVTALRTNNEQRAALVRELDEATGGAILSTIAGQQLSEALPRGLFRQIAAGIAGAGIVTGGISASMIPALVFASPRATGEFVRALGLGAAKTQQLIEAVGDARNVLIKAGAIGGAIEGASDLEE